MKIPRTVFILALVSFTLITTRAQDVEVAARLRLAQSFEQAGDWERAATIYEELHKADEGNYIIFDGLRRAYTQLKKYEEAISLVSQRLSMHLKDPLLTSILAGLYYDSGKEHAADSLWRQVLASDRKNPGLYRIVATHMLEHRLYDMAIQAYLSGRKEGVGEDAFAEELGSIYSALQQYGAATTEFVRMLKKSPDQLPYIENRVASFTMRNDGLRASTTIVQEETRKSPNNITLRMFLAWLAMEGRDFESAFVQYHVIDSLKKAKGSELYNFAQRLMHEKAFRVSARAFREIIDQQAVVSPTILPQARFGFARAVEELSTETDTSTLTIENARQALSWPVSETQPSFQGAIALYGRIVTEYPNSDLAGQALYRIGMIRLNKFFDLDGALTAFQDSRKSAKSQNVQFDASLRMAEVMVTQGRIRLARNEYIPLLHSTMTSYVDRAIFGMAELDYFEGAFDSSLAKLALLTSNTNIDLANDALQMQYFIQENKNNPQLLNEFSKADLLARQRKYSEALAALKVIVAQNPNAFLVDDGMMKMGEIQLTLRQTADALATFEKLANEMPTSILRDRAQLRIGEVYQNNLRDKGKAIEAYETLLAKYPNSMYAEEARKRIRLLRGDAI